MIDKLPYPYSFICYLIYMLFLVIISIIIGNDVFIHFLNEIIKKSHIKSELAAILILNIGNGIPDLLISIYSNENDIEILGVCASSYIFLISLVLGMIILFKNQNIIFERKIIYKNLIFLLISYFFLLFFCKNFFFLLTMIFFYIGFVLSSIFLEEDESEYGEVNGIEIFFIKKIFDFLFIRNFLKKDIHNYDDISENEINQILSSTSTIENRTKKYLKIFKSKKFQIFIVSLIHSLIPILQFSISFKYFPITFLIFLIHGLILNYFDWIIVYGFALSVLWIYILSERIVDVVVIIMDFLNISKKFCTIFLLPLNNCLGDLITGLLGTRKGFTKTYTLAALTAPIHNTLFNLPILFFYTTVYKIGSVGIFKIFVPIILIIFVYNFEINRGKIQKELGIVLIFIFFFYLLCTLF